MRFRVTSREMVTECTEDEIIHTNLGMRRRGRPTEPRRRQRQIEEEKL